MNNENTLSSNTKALSIFITLSLSLISQYLYLSSNRLMLSEVGGSEAGLFLPIINGVALPLLLLVNYSNSKIIHNLLKLQLFKSSLIMAAIIPVWSIIYVPLVLVFYPLIHAITGIFN